MAEKTAFIEDMFLQGCAFEKCGSLCYNNGKSQFFLSHPVIVNYSFACEVFLKALLFFHLGEIQSGHRLYELFSLLPDQSKKDIQQAVLMKYSQWNDAFGHPLLCQISDAFVEWRYSYEITSGGNNHAANIGFLIAFCEVLHKKCCEEIPACMKGELIL